MKTPRILIDPAGRSANQMLQYMLALNLQRLAGPLEIYGYDIPMWGLSAPAPSDFPKRSFRVSGQMIDVDHIASLIRKGVVTDLNLRGLGFRMSNYAPRAFYQNVFETDAPDIQGFDADHVVIHIRGGDILGTAHRDYYPVPFSYIDTVLDESGCKPVFIGELEDSYYSRKLRQRYAQAEFLPPQTPLIDFETIRRSQHIATSISSFSWLAAWLSSATRIHLPLGGMFDTRQRPDIDLLPDDESRYKFYYFEPRDWQANEADIEALWLPGRHRVVEHDEIRELKRHAKRRMALKFAWKKTKMNARARIGKLRTYMSG